MPEPRPLSPADKAWLAERGLNVPDGLTIQQCARGETGVLDEHGKIRPGVYKWSAANRGRKPKKRGRPPGPGKCIKPMPTPRTERDKLYVSLRQQGKSFNEIAAICGVRRGTVTSAFNYMRRREQTDG